MKIIETKKELSKILDVMVRAGNCVWHDSAIFPDMVFWNVEHKENSLTFPVIYTKKTLLKQLR